MPIREKLTEVDREEIERIVNGLDPEWDLDEPETAYDPAPPTRDDRRAAEEADAILKRSGGV